MFCDIKSKKNLKNYFIILSLWPWQTRSSVETLLACKNEVFLLNRFKLQSASANLCNKLFDLPLLPCKPSGPIGPRSPLSPFIPGSPRSPGAPFNGQLHSITAKCFPSHILLTVSPVRPEGPRSISLTVSFLNISIKLLRLHLQDSVVTVICSCCNISTKKLFGNLQ